MVSNVPILQCSIWCPKVDENITRVRNCPDVAILNSMFGLCSLVFLYFCLFVWVKRSESKNKKINFWNGTKCKICPFWDLICERKNAGKFFIHKKTIPGEGGESERGMVKDHKKYIFFRCASISWTGYVRRTVFFSWDISDIQTSRLYNLATL